ncbi:MAG: hypothetical protein P4L81_00010 [Candidatus Pacebacteria bacterium]|nr:hypothetical protein [Candidatus Paceibacterota bacterium]
MEEQWTRRSAEKTFDGKGCGRAWTRSPVCEAFNCMAKKAHPIQVNVWDCFSAAVQGAVDIFEDKLDSS